MQVLKKDLQTFGIEASKLEYLTVNQIRIAYHKLTKQINPERGGSRGYRKVGGSNCCKRLEIVTKEFSSAMLLTPKHALT